MLFSYTFTASIIFILVGDIVGILNESNFNLKVVIILHMFGFTMGLLFHWGVRRNEQILRRFLDKYFQPNFLDPRIVGLTEKGFKNKSIYLTVFYWIFHLNFVSSSFATAVVWSNFKDKKSYLLPSLYECAVQPRHYQTHWISWISSLCWNIDTFGKYLMVNSFVSAVYLTLLLPYGTTLLFYFFIINYMNAGLNVFEQKVKAFSDIPGSCVAGNPVNIEVDIAARHHLIGMIRYYKKLRG